MSCWKSVVALSVAATNDQSPVLYTVRANYKSVRSGRIASCAGIRLTVKARHFTGGRAELEKCARRLHWRESICREALCMSESGMMRARRPAQAPLFFLSLAMSSVRIAGQRKY